MAVLRFLLRDVVSVNVDIHRIGLTGEVTHAVREYLVLFDNDRVAPGWMRVDSPVDFNFTHATLDAWDADKRVEWLSQHLARDPESRSDAAGRCLLAIAVIDAGFLAHERIVKVALFAVGVEVLLSSRADAEAGRSSSLRIASRAAFLTCDAGCARSRAACPYVLGFSGQKHLWTTVEQWARIGEWRCSAFLSIARPTDMDPLFDRLSLFGARNEAVHTGRTSLTDTDLKWMRVHADDVIKGFLAWVTRHSVTSLKDLDDEIERGAVALGTMTVRP